MLSTEVLTTAAKSPWSNGICGRHNAIIGNIVEKVISDNNVAFDVALAWGLAAKNSVKR